MSPEEIAKCSSGIPELDAVLGGGFPERRVTLVEGGHGTGKTVLGLEFLVSHARKGTHGIFVSFEEKADAIRANAASMGWDIQTLEDEGKLAILSIDIGAEMVVSGAFDVSATEAIIRERAAAINAEVCVIDAFDWVLSLAASDEDRRHHLLRFMGDLDRSHRTTLFTVKQSSRESEMLRYFCDCIILLDHSTEAQVPIRRLQVSKYRGSGYLGNQHPFVISDDGIQFLPISNLSLKSRPPGDWVSTGNQALDALAGGGFHRGGTTLVAGPSGSGKTTLLSTFAASACSRGEGTLAVLFEESEDSLVFSMQSPGIGLREHLTAGTLRSYTCFPEAKGSDEHLIAIIRMIDEFKPRQVCVDSLTAVERTGSDHAAFDFKVRLLQYCKQRDISCIGTVQTREANVSLEMGRYTLSSIVDTVVTLDWQDCGQAFHRSLMILKSRGVAHANRAHGFSITDAGLEFNDDAPPGVAGSQQTP